MRFDQDNFLDIYAIAEYLYCPRASFYFITGSEDGQEENNFMQRGRSVHQNIDLPGKRYREGFHELKGIYLKSLTYGIKGKADLVREYNYFLVPVEYKSGSFKDSEFHKFQLTLQAICLEEQLNKLVTEAFVYFYQVNKSQKYEISELDKENVIKKLKEIREKLEKPNINDFKQVNKPNCSNCSFYDICMPDIKL